MLEDPVIRPATSADLPEVAALWRELMDFHARRDVHFALAPDGQDNFIGFLEEQISSKTSCVLVALVDDEIVGYCQGNVAEYPPVFLVRSYGTIHDLAVTAAHQRSGVGQALVGEIVRWFRDKGMARIEVRVSVKNEISTRFWGKVGFVPYLEALYMDTPGEEPV